MQGEAFEPPEGVSPAAVRHFATHQKQMETNFHELDEEYRQNFKDHVFKTYVNYTKFMSQIQQEQQASQLAAKLTGQIDTARAQQGPQQGAAPGQGAPNLDAFPSQVPAQSPEAAV